MSISDGSNSHPKTSSWVEDYPYTYILPKAHHPTRYEILIAPLEMWVRHSPSETAQTQYLEHTTTIWTTCTCYIGRKLFIWGNHMLGFHHELWYHISDEPNSHQKTSSWMEDYPYTYLLPKNHHPTRCETLIMSYRIKVVSSRKLAYSYKWSSYLKCFISNIIPDQVDTRYIYGHFMYIWSCLFARC